MAGSTSSARNAFFWIHDIWGNYHQFIASVFVRVGSTLKIHHTLSRMANPANWDNNSWNSTSNYASMSSKGFDTGSMTSGMPGFYTSACGSNGAGFLKSSDSSAASGTTGWPDLGLANSSSSGAHFPIVGGYYDDGGYAGLFCARVSFNSAGSDGSYCARLSFRG